MNFGIPRRLAYFVIAGLFLLAVAGAADSIGNALRDNYTADCDPYRVMYLPEPRDAKTDPTENDTSQENGEQGEEQTPDEEEPTLPTKDERDECRAARLPVTLVDVITRATLGPGIAIVALSGVFLISAAISARRR